MLVHLAGDFGPIGPCFNPNEDNVNFQPGDDDQADRDNRWLNVWTHMADAAAKSGGKAVQVYDEVQGLSQMQRAEATIAGYLGLRVERRRLGLAGGAVTGHRGLQMSLPTGQRGSSGPAISSSTLQVDAQFALKMPSPVVTPPRGPSPERLVATLSRTNSAELLLRRWGRSRGDAQSPSFEVYPVLDIHGGPAILGNHELHRAILVSHSRRDPAALNLTYAVVDGLRTGLDPETGQPFSKHCHKDSRRVELWLDKEQLSESGGDDWTEPILRAMRDGVVTVFCLGNAFCGSKECRTEVQYAVQEGFATIPVFLEWLCKNEPAFEQWKSTPCRQDVPGGAESLLDANVRQFREWQAKADVVKFRLGQLQGVPADLFSLHSFVCQHCRGTKDSRCRSDGGRSGCSEWSTSSAGEAGPKLIQAVRALGKYIDAHVQKKLQEIASPPPNLPLKPLPPEDADPEPGPESWLSPPPSDVGTTVELRFDGTIGDTDIVPAVLDEVQIAVMEALWIEIEQLQVSFPAPSVSSKTLDSSRADRLSVSVEVMSSWFDDFGGVDEAASQHLSEASGPLKDQLTAMLRASIEDAAINVQVVRGSVRVIISGLPRWAAIVLASVILGGATRQPSTADLRRRVCTILHEYVRLDYQKFPAVFVDGVQQILPQASQSEREPGPEPEPELGPEPEQQTEQQSEPELESQGRYVSQFEQESEQIEQTQRFLQLSMQVPAEAPPASKSETQAEEDQAVRNLSLYGNPFGPRAVGPVEMEQALRELARTREQQAALESEREPGPEPQLELEQQSEPELGSQESQEVQLLLAAVGRKADGEIGDGDDDANAAYFRRDFDDAWRESTPVDEVERVEQMLRQNGGRVSRQELLLHNIRTPDLALEERRLRNPAASVEEGVSPDMEPQPEDEPEPELDGSLASYLERQQQINSFIEDPIDGARLNIMQQCVNVSVSSADASAEDAVHAICSRCRLPQRDGVFHVCLWNQWASARFLTENVDGTVNLSIAVQSVWTTAPTTLNMELTIDGVAIKCQGSIKLQASGTDATNWTATIQGQSHHPSRTCKGQDTWTAILPSIPLRAEVQTARLRVDPSQRYTVTTTTGQTLHVGNVNRAKQVQCRNQAGSLLETNTAELEFLFECVPGDIQIRVPRAAVATMAVHVTGPAACGKSTLTKQCMYKLARADVDADGAVVPYRVAVIDVANIIQRNGLRKTDDILGKHIEEQDPVFAAVLLAIRRERRLLLVLDGIDEVGGARDVLEPYITEKLCREVFLCVTGRENGIGQTAREEFRRKHFVPIQIKPLSTEQQGHIIAGRLQDETRIQQFTNQLQQSFAELGQTPLLLNLMISEYLLHESDSDGIRFDGRIVPGQTEYVASFPGVEQHAWKRVTVTLQHKSVACVWLPDDCDLVGRHYADPQNDGKCFCQTFLYNDLSPEVAGQGCFKMIMADSDVHTTEDMPAVDKKVEVLFAQPTPRWWICSVEQVNVPEQRLFIKVDGRGGKHSGEWQFLNEIICSGEWLSLSDDRLNRSGHRKTDQQVGQAPFGCKWFEGWKNNVHEAEEEGQQAIVVFKKSHRGERSTAGLGNSQLKELEYLETVFPERYGGGRGWKEVDAAEFEKEYAMNRAQIYESATKAMVEQRSKEWARTAELDDVRIHAFLAELAYRSHIRDGTSAQDRKFSDAFAQDGSSYGSMWMTLVQPLVKQSRFPLISWEPDEQSENEFMFSHLSFQEYYTACYVVMDEPHAVTCDDELEPESEDAESSDTAISTRSRVYTFAAEVNQHGLFEKDRYQVVVQMCVELLANRDAARLSQLIDVILQPKQSTVAVSSHLSSATSVRTLSSLVCASSRLSTLDLSDSGLSVESITDLAHALPMMTIKKLILSQNKLFGADGRGRPTADADQSGWNALCDALPDSPLEELVVADIGMGVKGLTSLAKAMSAGAVNEVNVSQNPIGVEGGKALANVIPECLSLRWIVVGKAARIPVHNSEVTSIDASGQDLGPGEVTVLAAAISTDGLTDVNMSSNPLTGEVDYNGRPLDGKDISGVAVLFPAMTKIITLNVSNCGLGPTAMPELSKLVSDATAVLASLTVSGNPLTGATCDLLGDWSNIDSDMSGFVALCAVLGKLTHVDLSDCHLGPTSTGELAKVFSDADAVIAHVALSGNMIDLRASNVGYSYAKYDLDLSGIIALGEAVVVSKTLTSIDLSKCGISVAGVTEVAKFISAGAAGLASLTVDSTGDTKDSWGHWNNGGPQTYTLIETDTTIDLSKKNLGSADVTLLTEWMKRPEVSAALTMVDIRGAKINQDKLDALKSAAPVGCHIFSDQVRGTTMCGCCGSRPPS